jgi:hypothetical protein
MGTGLGYMSASALYRLTRPPYIAGGLGMWWGYVKSMLTQQPRLDDPKFRAFVRRFQWSCLLHGKSKATNRENARRAPFWRPNATSKWLSPEKP